jgi:hypothetical protein
MTIINHGEGLLSGLSTDFKPKPNFGITGSRFIEFEPDFSKFTSFLCDGIKWTPQTEFSEEIKNKTIDYNLNNIINLPVTSGGSGINSASNVGVTGFGLFKQITGVNLEFCNVDIGSNKLTLVQDLIGNTVTFDVNEVNFRFDTGIKTKPITVPTTDAAYGIYYSDSADVNKPKFKKPDGTVIDLASGGGGGVSLASANTWSAVQTISIGGSPPLILYRTASTLGFGCGIQFDLDSGTAVRHTYGLTYVSIEDNIGATVRGDYFVQLAVNNTLGTRFRVYTFGNGGILFGNNQRAQLDETGLTVTRIFTFPDADSLLAGQNFANTFIPVQKFEVGIKIKPITVPTTDASYGIFYSDSADVNKPKFKKPDGTVIDLSSSGLHATTHKSGGTDPIKLDELAVPTDITTLNSTTSLHGLLPKLGGGTTNFLRADGTWSPPPGAGTGAPTSSKYVTIGADGTLSEERALTAGDGITILDGGANSTVTIGQDFTDLGRKRVVFLDDFFSNSNSDAIFIVGTSGTAASVTNLPVSELGVYGVWQLGTGTTTTGSASIQAGNLSSFSLGQGLTTLEWYINIPTLSTITEEFSLRIGFMDSITGASTDGMYFRYDRLTTTFWRISARANSVSTDATTATTVVTGWTRLKIVVNAAGTSASFFVNGTEVSGSPLTTNIPTGAGRETTVAASLIKSAGSSARVVNFDYVAFDIDLTTPR